MKEVSNNVLVSLAVFAIVAVTFSILVNMNIIDTLSITGAASSGPGYANVSIVSVTDITIVNDTINFTSSNPGDIKESNDSATVEPDGGFNITNDGSVNVNISLLTNNDLFSGTQSATSFTCRVANVTVGGDYNAGADSQENYTDCRNSAGTLSGFVHNLNFVDGSDDVQIDIKIVVPSDEAAGQKGADITFTASVAA